MLVFTSVMIDASHSPIEENIATNKKCVEVAHIHGVSVEAEVGRWWRRRRYCCEEQYADPAECKRLVQETNVDCFAPALGSVHGPYKGEPKLGFKEMEEV